LTNLEGQGEVFRRDKGRELLCTCTYELEEGPQEVVPAGPGHYIAGFTGDITGTIDPAAPMTPEKLMEQADKSGLLQLRLAGDRWLDFILKPDGSIVGSGGIRDER
jgi:hypothetical protein